MVAQPATPWTTSAPSTARASLQGRSYAIDTMSGLDAMAVDIAEFLTFAAAHPELTFLVTEIGCGIAGYTPAQVAPHFASAPDNVALPSSFAGFAS